MKYPRTRKEAEKALETYKLSLFEDNPLLIINLKNDISEDYEEVNVMDVLLVEPNPCEKPFVCMKSMSFDLCDPTSTELEITTEYLEVKNLLAASDAIEQYVYSCRELDDAF